MALLLHLFLERDQCTAAPVFRINISRAIATNICLCFDRNTLVDYLRVKGALFNFGTVLLLLHGQNACLQRLPNYIFLYIVRICFDILNLGIEYAYYKINSLRMNNDE